jgi:hypothetical protein
VSDDLDDLFPQPRIVRLLGRTVEILPASLPQLRSAARVIQGWQRICDSQDPLDTAAEELPVIVAALSELTGLPRDELAACEAKDLPGIFDVVNAVVVANVGFFARRVLPVIYRGIPAARAALNGSGGPTFSPGSSEPVTAGPN